MAYPLLGTFLNFVEVLRPALTRPGYANFVVLVVGWVLTQGPHAVTQALVCTQVAGRRHHEAFHRFSPVAVKIRPRELTPSLRPPLPQASRASRDAL